MRLDGTDERQEVQKLLGNLRTALPALEKLLVETCSHSGYEDSVYRFYHSSFKVYAQVQPTTLAITAALRDLAPDARPLNAMYMQIVTEGTNRNWEPAHNQRWLEATRPMLEAFFHAKYFLEMAVRYGKELEAPPQLMPSGWAALLYLYDLR